VQTCRTVSRCVSWLPRLNVTCSAAVWAVGQCTLLRRSLETDAARCTQQALHECHTPEPCTVQAVAVTNHALAAEEAAQGQATQALGRIHQVERLRVASSSTDPSAGHWDTASVRECSRHGSGALVHTTAAMSSAMRAIRAGAPLIDQVKVVHGLLDIRASMPWPWDGVASIPGHHWTL
jgi:hypothetical protein